MTTKTDLIDNNTSVPRVTDITPGNVSFQMTPEELSATIQLLNFARGSFKALADQAVANGETDNARSFADREAASTILVNRYKALAMIGEPTERNIN